MLNISKNNFAKNLSKEKYSTLKKIENKKSGYKLKRMLFTTFFITMIAMFIPWTQNLKTYGTITTLKPHQRPQTLNAIIGGQVEEWYIQEGDLIEKGDTILRISEVKDAYFDVDLLKRTKNQIELKKQTITTYDNKINNFNKQLSDLKKQRDLKIAQSKIKLKQAKLKVENDFIAYQTSIVNLNIANYQFSRTDSLYGLGLKSLSALEAKKLKRQQVETYKVKAENTWKNSKAGLENLQMDILTVDVKYRFDYNKIDAYRLSTENDKINSKSSLNKLENQFSNYEFRTGLYYVLASQSGYVTRIKIGGQGETLKAGQAILTIMPKEYELAAEVFVNPVDLPLIQIGERVRLQFDGWPAIVFSGWPDASVGTYGGVVYAVDHFISENGKYRLLVKQDLKDDEWPSALRFGGGTSSMILLNDVPIWYELWRNLNGFPPNFYKNKKDTPKKSKK